MTLPILAAFLISDASATDLDALQAALLTSPEAVHQILDLGALVDAADPDARAEVAHWVKHRAPAGILFGQVAHAGDRVSVVTNDEEHVVLRFLQDDGSVDYLDLKLGRRDCVADWTWLSDGVSATERIATASKGGEEGLQAMIELQGRTVGVTDRRTAALEALKAASDAGVEAALTAVRSAFPGQIWPDLAVLDRQLVAGAWDEVERSLDRIDAVVGDDPWVDAVRGLVADARGDDDQARALLTFAMNEDPLLAETELLPGYAPHGYRW